MAPPKYLCAHCRKPLYFRQRGGVFKFVHHRRSQDIACDADVARKAAEEICPPAIVDASEGYTESVKPGTVCSSKSGLSRRVPAL